MSRRSTATPREIDEPGTLRSELCERLQSAAKGLTYGELAQRLPAEWKHSFVKQAGLFSFRAAALKPLIHELWIEGRLEIEPPLGKAVAPRIWHPAHLQRGPRTVAAPASDEVSSTPGLSTEEQFREVYRRFRTQHRHGAVNVFKIRRELGWPRKEFDLLLSELAGRRDNPIHLISGNRGALSRSEQEDSFFQDGELYINVRWEP
jgi:hypothetical protein